MGLILGLSILEILAFFTNICRHVQVRKIRVITLATYRYASCKIKIVSIRGSSEFGSVFNCQFSKNSEKVVSIRRHTLYTINH